MRKKPVSPQNAPRRRARGEARRSQSGASAALPPFWLLLFLLSAAARAETHTLTLKQTASRALTQSPEALLARLDEQKAARDVEVARDPFHPKAYAGSGLAYSYGFPMSIEGSAPSILQAKGVASLYNRKQRLQLEQAREGARGTAIAASQRREEALFRAVELYLDAERKGRLAELARRQIESARKLDEVVKVRVAEGRELPVEAKRSALEVARSEQRVTALEAERDYAEGSLAFLLGYQPGDRVRPAAEDREPAPPLPGEEDEAVRLAAADNKEIRRLESALAAKGLAAQAERASRLPQLDLVAQYALFGRFNNYEDFFRRFQRHNGQIGMSVQVPLWLGPAAKALAAKADFEGAQLRIELAQARGRLALETQRRYRDHRTADSARQLARLDLDVAREQLSVELARLEEGRSSLKRVEELRLAEQEKWMAYFDAQAGLERARFALLEKTGGLAAALR